MATAKILVARVGADPGQWRDPANYRWWNGTWTPDAARAVPLVSVPFAGSVHVADYAAAGAHRFAMIVQTGFGDGGFQIFEADMPTGPWRPGPSARVPEECSPMGYGCYAISGHAELSTDERFVFSWYSPGDVSGAGHVRVGAVDW